MFVAGFICGVVSTVVGLLIAAWIKVKNDREKGEK